MDDERIIGSMVRVLRQHPAEWLTFGRLSSLIAMPDCDGDVLAAIAEYRPDLFAISGDRRLKLRMDVVEDVAHQGMSNWRVPARPEQTSTEKLVNRAATTSGTMRGDCYCSVAEEEVLMDLTEGTIPDEALIFSCCWRYICRVRGRFFNQVSAETWVETCQRRGYLQQRENPRGF